MTVMTKIYDRSTIIGRRVTDIDYVLHNNNPWRRDVHATRMFQIVSRSFFLEEKFTIKIGDSIEFVDVNKLKEIRIKKLESPILIFDRFFL